MVRLGSIYVDMLDAGGNMVRGMDGKTHVVNVTSCTAETQLTNAMLLTRTTGAKLQGKGGGGGGGGAG